MRRVASDCSMLGTHDLRASDCSMHGTHDLRAIALWGVLRQVGVPEPTKGGILLGRNSPQLTSGPLF